MSEWWTYSLADFLMFSPHTYYRLFALYNIAIWPGQIVALTGGVAILVFLRGGSAWHGRAIAAILAVGWAWTAWAYLLDRYDTINWAGRNFAAGFALEAVLLGGTGLVAARLRFRPATDIVGRCGLGLFLFALAGYPLLPRLTGRAWTEAEIFGLAPDPTAIGTLGLLATMVGRGHWPLSILPLLWCLISGTTLWSMGSPEAGVVTVAAVAALGLLVWKSNAPAATH
jgi:hypothetical protein